MIEELTQIFKELQSSEPIEFNYQASLQRYRLMNDKFDALLSIWLEDIRMGQIIPIEKILLLIDQEIHRRKSLGEYANPKRNNSMEIIYGFRKKMRRCEFEISRRDQEIPDNECECDMRLAHRLAPEQQTLKKYGIANFVHGEEYLIYECTICHKRWIEENIGGGGAFISNWIEWKNDTYRLSQIFTDSE